MVCYDYGNKTMTLTTKKYFFPRKQKSVTESINISTKCIRKKNIVVDAARIPWFLELCTRLYEIYCAFHLKHYCLLNSMLTCSCRLLSTIFAFIWNVYDQSLEYYRDIKCALIQYNLHTKRKSEMSRFSSSMLQSYSRCYKKKYMKFIE